MNIRSTGVAAVILLAITLAARQPATGEQVVAAHACLPSLPGAVLELYLPAERAAAEALYRLYAALPEDDVTSLHSGDKVYFSSPKLDGQAVTRLATWFNSARFGCDPPAESLDADGVRRSTLVLKWEESVIEFCMQSPREGIWKKLTIACAPERAEWVRDGLPLFPHWFHPEGWDGGPEPPFPRPSEASIKVQEMACQSSGIDPAHGIAGMRRFLVEQWELLRAVYPLYAELPGDGLRELHAEGELHIPLQRFSPRQQRSLVSGIDNVRLALNRGFGAPLGHGRPRDARARQFGITEIVFQCKRSSENELYPVHLSGVDPCPPPFRRVFVYIETPYPHLTQGGGWDSHTFHVAMPPALQRSMIKWQREYDEWQATWHVYDGSRAHIKPGAPPPPRHPPDQVWGEAPLPCLPKSVSELCIPEECDACAALYPIYSALPDSDLARLHSGEKAYVAPASLNGDAAVKLAAWFNSARFGCDPPAESLDADGVRRSTLVLKCEESVIEFCMQSPREGIWKKLAIACAPERAEWVRDGLPLLPHWAYVSWNGGHRPPQPRQEAFDLRWRSLVGVYRVYAELPSESLRTLHTQCELRLRFADLLRRHQESVVYAVDKSRLLSNLAFGPSLDFRRTPEARAKHFGITEVVFTYRRSHPDLPYPLENNLPGVDPCPPPFKQIFVTVDDSYPAVSGWGGGEHTFVVAVPVELQRSLRAWRREMDVWLAECKGVADAPPYPRHPAD
jgi:hypothetical protein